MRETPDAATFMHNGTAFGSSVHVDNLSNRSQCLGLMHSKTHESDNRPKRQRLCGNDNELTAGLVDQNGLHSKEPPLHPIERSKMESSSGSSSFDTRAAEGESNNFMDSELGARVLEFQKKAIWCQMIHYKRLYIREHEIAEHIKSREDAYVAITSLFIIYLEKMKILLEFLYKSYPPANAGLLNPKDSLNLSRTIEMLHDMDFPIQNVDSAIMEHFKELEMLINAIALAMKNPTQISGSEDTSLREHQSTIVSELDQVDEMNVLRVTVKRFRSKIASLEEELDKTKDLLERAERKLDKIQINASLERSGNENFQKEQKLNEKSIQGAISALEAEKSLSESRLAEIEKLRYEKHRLLSELSNERSKLTLLIKDNNPDDRDGGISIPRAASSELKYVTKENSILKSKLEEAEHQIEALKLERRDYVEKLQADESDRRSVLEAQIKRLNQDLQRVRANRDYLQHSLNLRISSNEGEISRSQKLSAIAKAKEERIASLMEEIRCLRLIIVGSTGDNALYQLFEMYHGEDLAKSLESQISTYKKKIDSLTVSLLSLEKRSFQSRDGFAISENKEIRRLTDSLSESEITLKELKEKLGLSEKTQVRLLTEIENLGEAWTELEKQAKGKLLDSSSPEEVILRYTAEKSKLEQKNLILMKQLASQAGQIKTFKMKSDKQTEQIALVGQREKILISQLKNVEKELSLANALSQKYQHKVGDLMSQVADLKASEKKWASRHSSAVAHFKEKLFLYEENEERSKKLLEEKKLLCEQLNSLKNVVSSESSNSAALLKKELEEYKFLLKCSSCNTRFKSHVLTKCMHTFCKECIEETWNSRQRKCPSCGVNFSKQEARQIYL